MKIKYIYILCKYMEFIEVDSASDFGLLLQAIPGFQYIMLIKFITILIENRKSACLHFHWGSKWYLFIIWKA